jgi:hypothetical protein
MIGAVLCANSTALNAAVIWEVYPTAFTALSSACAEDMRGPSCFTSSLLLSYRLLMQASQTTIATPGTGIMARFATQGAVLA